MSIAIIIMLAGVIALWAIWAPRKTAMCECTHTRDEHVERGCCMHREGQYKDIEQMLRHDYCTCNEYREKKDAV